MRLVIRTLLIGAMLILGWAGGTAIGLAIGLVWDAAAGDVWVSNVLLTIPLGGLTGVLIAAIWGIPAVVRRT